MEKQIGRVTHYFTRLGVAVLALDDGLTVGDTVRIVGRTTDFTQTVSSMEVEHRKLQEVGPGADVALQVDERVRMGDVVYKITPAESIPSGFGGRA
jgi:putative protease